MKAITRKAILVGFIASLLCCSGLTAQAAEWKPRVSSDRMSYIEVSWSPVSGAKKYRVYRSTSSNMAGAVRVYTGTKWMFYDKSAMLGYKYYYRVEAETCCSVKFSRTAWGNRKMTLKVSKKRVGNKLWVGATVNGGCIACFVITYKFTRSGAGASTWKSQGRYFGAKKDSNWYMGYFTKRSGTLKFGFKVGKTLIKQQTITYRW